MQQNNITFLSNYNSKQMSQQIYIYYNFIQKHVGTVRHLTSQRLSFMNVNVKKSTVRWLWHFISTHARRRSDNSAGSQRSIHQERAMTPSDERNIDVLLLTEPYYPVYQTKICDPDGTQSVVLGSQYW